MQKYKLFLDPNINFRQLAHKYLNSIYPPQNQRHIFQYFKTKNTKIQEKNVSLHTNKNRKETTKKTFDVYARRMMNEFEHIQYSPIQNYQYERWFQDTHYNGKTLNDDERREFIKRLDEIISDISEELPTIKRNLENIKEFQDEGHNVYRIIISVLQFIGITMIDSMVIGKYFILANKDYDRRFMRGKMRVILNEGFKKLYGFDKKTHEKSEWNRLAPIIKHFPEDIQHQYQHLSALLEEQSKSSYWWRDERNVETHFDAEELYDSRCEDIVESKVMMDSLRLYNTLYAVDCFLFNMHTCVHNTLVDMYRSGELREE